MVGEGVGGVGEISTARPADVAASTCFQNCHSCPSSQNTSQLAKTEKSKE